MTVVDVKTIQHLIGGTETRGSSTRTAPVWNPATGEHQARSAAAGGRLLGSLREAGLGLVAGVRGRGLWIGIDVVPGGPSARELCERLMRRGLLCKDTHESTIRLAPPLTIEDRELEFVLDALRAELA